MSKYNVRIKVSSDGEYVRKYASNPLYGYILLESDEPYIDLTVNFNDFIESKGDQSKLPKRQAILRGKTETLLKFVVASNNQGASLPGRIRVLEYLENEIPENIKAKHLRDDVSFEEAILPYIKKYNYKTHFKLTKNDATIMLKSSGQRILHFKEWCHEGREDVFIHKYDREVEKQFHKLFHDALKPPQITTLDEVLTTNIKSNKNERKETKTTIQEDKFSELKSVDTKKERSHESIKRENRIVTPIIFMLLTGVIALMIYIPSIFTVLAVIFGSIIIFYFAGAFYEAIFSKHSEFDLLRTILIGLVVIIILGIFLFIGEITQTPDDPDMWRHP